MTDTETAAAVKALAHRLRTRDAAIHDGEDHADPEVFAGEFVAAMQGYGWRHVPALAKPAPVSDGDPGPSEATAALVEAARQRMAAVNAAAAKVATT